MHRFRRVLSIAEDVVFPPICAGCRRRGTWFCDRCLGLAQQVPHPICFRCGQPATEPLFTCARCAQWPNEVGSVRASFVFSGPVREQVHRFKYQGEFARAPVLAGLMNDRIIDRAFVDHTSWDLVAYVPLHKGRRRQRGFDQSELIARHLAGRLGLPLTRELKRIRETPSQVGRGESERQANVRDAFSWDGGPLAGKKILLVDDVITTGSTMISACRPILGAGAARIDGFAFARELLNRPGTSSD